IRRGLSRGRTEIHFPKRFTYLLKLMSFLPTLVWQKMIQRDNQPRALKDAGR
ncbi:MAG: short-chain dehydrogenase, partial [Shewanella sp.]